MKIWSQKFEKFDETSTEAGREERIDMEEEKLVMRNSSLEINECHCKNEKKKRYFRLMSLCFFVYT